MKGRVMKLDSHPLNTPFDFHGFPLSSTCVCLSKYDEQERFYLEEVVHALGTFCRLIWFKLMSIKKDIC